MFPVRSPLAGPGFAAQGRTDFCGFAAAPVQFAVSSGSVDPETAVFQSLCDPLDQSVYADAVTSFTPPTKAGPVEIRATLDNQTVSGTMMIGSAPSPSGPITTAPPAPSVTPPPTSTSEPSAPIDGSMPIALGLLGSLAVGLTAAFGRRRLRRDP